MKLSFEVDNSLLHSEPRSPGISILVSFTPLSPVPILPTPESDVSPNIHSLGFSEYSTLVGCHNITLCFLYSHYLKINIFFSFLPYATSDKLYTVSIMKRKYLKNLAPGTVFNSNKTT